MPQQRLQKGDWVFIDAPSGDDNGAKIKPAFLQEERGYTKNDLPGELFNLREDISERRNYDAEPNPSERTENRMMIAKQKA